MTVISQQISLAAGRTFGARLVAGYGAPGPAGLALFPTPQTLAGVPAADPAGTVGLTGRAHEPSPLWLRRSRGA
jgi:3-methyladenine DNA glycosylase/8-oxoguanine DNA glycosylase